MEKLKLKAASWRTLIEATRRYTRFHQGEDLLKAWTGLGTPPEYRQAVNDGYMEVLHGKAKPRIASWYRLTEKGAKIVKFWLEKGYDYNKIENNDIPPITLLPES
jgi:hypothetical protein